jgi:hypothetical protein
VFGLSNLGLCTCHGYPDFNGKQLEFTFESGSNVSISYEEGTLCFKKGADKSGCKIPLSVQEGELDKLYFFAFLSGKDDKAML